MNFFLSPLALGDIFGNSGDSIEIPCRIFYRESTIPDPAHRAVRPLHAILDFKTALTISFTYLSHTSAVLRVNRIDKGVRVSIQTFAGSPPDPLIRGANVEESEERPAEVSCAHPEYFMNVLGDLTKALFALSQCGGPLQNHFCKRAIPPDQARDEQHHHRRRIAHVGEITPIRIDRAAEPFLVELLQLAWFDGCKALRHGA